MIELLNEFMGWYHEQPILAQLYVNYVIVRSIIIKFASDSTKRWLVEPVWVIVRAGLRRLFRPLTNYAINWYARRDFSSTGQL